MKGTKANQLTGFYMTATLALNGLIGYFYEIFMIFVKTFLLVCSVFTILSVYHVMNKYV